MGAASSREGVGYDRGVCSAKASRHGVIAALIVSSEAWRCSGGAYKIRETSLSAKEGRCSGCALPRNPPVSGADPGRISIERGVIRL